MIKRSSLSRFAGLVLIFGMLGYAIGSARAEEKPAAAAQESAAAAQPTAEELKLTQPGPEHERLKALVGEFDGDYEIFLGPDAPAQRSKGKITNELLYDGRFLQGRFEGEMLGKPFIGQNLIGYDNIKKRYVATWINDGATSITYAEGAADAQGKVITLESEEKDDDPSHKVKTQFVTTIIDKDHYRFETIVIPPGVKPFTVARITYKRH